MDSRPDNKLDKRYPSVADIERAALKRVPPFVGEYVGYGMGLGGSVRRNRYDLDAIRLMPHYLEHVGEIKFQTRLFGKTYAAPFGVAPVGLGGFIWPHSAQHLARAAKTHEVPFVASTFALASLETFRQCAGECAWYQLYRPNIKDIETDLLNRAADAGYDVLVVTADIPSPMRRDHDIRNGFAIPPKLSLRTIFQTLTHPQWALAMAASGIPEFDTMTRYIPVGMNKTDSLQFLSELTTGNITSEIISAIRKKWQGKLVIKGILNPLEARQCQDLGVDGIIVSNHGGRQLEAAPSACEVLGQMREKVDKNFTLIADGGVRTGLDICRMLSLGADFVMMGRPFYYAIAAMGPKGADHIMKLFKAEMQCVMGQLGCSTLAELPSRLIKP